MIKNKLLYNAINLKLCFFDKYIFFFNKKSSISLLWIIILLTLSVSFSMIQ